jgi:enoyl-CoA hydratase
MVYRTLSFEKKGYVALVSLFPLSDQVKVSYLSGEIADICEAITWDEAIRVVVITGTEKGTFSLRINPFGQEDSLCSIADPVAKLTLPVIAALDGNVTGQGLELALACDVRIATEGARFGLPHVRSGFMPSDGGTQRLPRLVGPGKALEMILTGELIDAAEALRIGLINRTVNSSELTSVAMELASDMASKSPLALSYVKEALYSGMDLTLDQGLRMELDLYLLLFTTQDRTEGVRAFVEKRKPEFEGR